MRDEGRPRWWWLYAVGAVLVAMLGLVEPQVGEGALRTVLEVVVAIAGFSLMSVWLRVNRLALELEKGRRRA
jgi:uncharacterized membrane protein HdeD (DUF308 family)